MKYQFPKGFLWGTATAAYQIEGGFDQDGKGESIWDRFVRKPGRIKNGDTGEVACDHYHRWAEDLSLMQELGVNAYRFSLSWPRIFPTGYGRPNRRGVDFYRRLVEGLRERGITPLITLYHWDLPQALQDKGGWPNRDTVYYFRDYAGYMFEEFKDLVPLWITHNEPFVASFFGYGTGENAPGVHSLPKIFQSAHHFLLSHGEAVKAFRQIMGEGKGQIGLANFLWRHEPVSNKPRDQKAAKRAEGLISRWYRDPVFTGSYPRDVWTWIKRRFAAPKMKSDDLAIISQPIDFLGVNYYSRNLYKANALNPVTGFTHVKRGPLSQTDMGWEVYPEGLYLLLKELSEKYHVPLYITENGAAYPDRLVDGEVRDVERCSYLRQHIIQAHRGIQDGVDLRGYFVWSLLDNFEWAHGYSKRFGLFYVDYQTQKRYWKESAKFYQQVAQENGLVIPD
jgi:beta-glucosidase